MENEDPVTIAQSGISPITGSPLSSEQRKVFFRRAVAPSSILGGGGALVRRTDDSSSLVVAQTQQITSLQDQINVLRVEVSTLNNGLTSINTIIQRDGILEQQRLRGEQESERRNLERGVRIGKENELERKIQSALMVPVVALQKKVTNIFGNIFGALSTLFMGWLTNQGIETLKALDEGNKGKLEQIKDTVLKNIAYAIGGIAAIKIGFGLIIRSVIGLTARISAIAVRLALAPFRFLGSQLAKVPGAVGGLFGGGGKKPPAPPKIKPTASGGNLWSRATNFIKGAGAATKGATAAAAKTGGSLISKLFAPVNIGISAYRFSQGDIPGGALSALSALPIIGLPAVGVDIAREFGAFEGSFLGKNEKERQSQTKQEPTPAATPQTTMMPQASELSITPPQESAPLASPQTTIPAQPIEISPVTPQTTMMPQVGTPSLTQEPVSLAAPQTTMMPLESELTLSPQSQESVSSFQQEAGKNMMQMSNNTQTAYSMPSLISSAEMQNIPTQSPNIGNLPEPQPNVVMLPAPQSQRRQSMIGSSSAGSDAPLINSANPDNFYVLYSQLNYNVVM
jgi:hypothetical protein